jgi:hypothetical protein
VHVVFDRLPRGFRGCREERPDIDVEAEIGLRPSSCSNASTSRRTRSTDGDMVPTSRL